MDETPFIGADPHSSPMKKPFYGWWITSMGVLGNAFQGGLIFWTMGIYTSTCEDEFQSSRAKINLIKTLLSVLGVDKLFNYSIFNFIA